MKMKARNSRTCAGGTHTSGTIPPKQQFQQAFDIFLVGLHPRSDNLAYLRGIRHQHPTGQRRDDVIRLPHVVVVSKTTMSPSRKFSLAHSGNFSIPTRRGNNHPLLSLVLGSHQDVLPVDVEGKISLGFSNKSDG